MTSTLKIKLLQSLAAKKSNKGFTLIELLVVVIIIGILAAIALPNLMNQSNKAKQSEAKQNVAAINRAQSAYRTESAGFADEFDLLALGNLAGGTTDTTTNYAYTLDGQADTSTISAAAQDSALKSYAGNTSRYTNSAGLSVTGSVACETNVPSATAPTPTAPSQGTPKGDCDTNSTKL